MSANTWLKFYPSDWRSDPRLRMCSIAARGLWIEILALMHEAEPYGHLLVNDLAPTDTQMASLTGAPSDQLPILMAELESAGVFSRTRTGVIYSRRMTRDHKRAKIATENGKKGGNPSISNQRVIPPPDNPHVKPPDKGGDKTHIPEARSTTSTEVGVQRPLEWKRSFWDSGRQFLVENGQSAKNAGSLLGQWRKTYGEAEVMNALAKAESECPSNVVEFIFGCLKQSKKPPAQLPFIRPVEKKLNNPSVGTPEWEEMMRRAGA